MFPWLNIPSPGFHSIAHSGAAAFTQKIAIDTWFFSQVAYLAAQLGTNPEGGHDVGQYGHPGIEQYVNAGALIHVLLRLPPMTENEATGVPPADHGAERLDPHGLRVFPAEHAAKRVR